MKKLVLCCGVIFCLIIFWDIIFLLVNNQFPIKNIIVKNIFMVGNIIGLICGIIYFLGRKIKFYWDVKVKF